MTTHDIDFAKTQADSQIGLVRESLSRYEENDDLNVKHALLVDAEVALGRAKHRLRYAINESQEARR